MKKSIFKIKYWYSCGKEHGFGIATRHIWFLTRYKLSKHMFNLKDWYSFGKVQGFWFATKYKLGIAKEGKDFY